MTTTTVLDDDLLAEAFALTAARTKRELIHLALQVLIRTRKKKHNLLDLAGEIRFSNGFDHEDARKLRE